MLTYARTTPGARLARTLVPAAVLTAAVLTAAVLTTAGGAARAQTNTKPSNVSGPTITGTPAQGGVLTAEPGTWNGAPAPTFAYQWQRCDTTGSSCSAIQGATQSTFTLGSIDAGNTLRVRVVASNSAGASAATSVPSAVVSAPPQPPVTGCPTAAAGATSIAVATLSTPARLQVDQFQPTPAVIAASTQTFTVRVHVSDTCGQAVSGANVFATAVPYNQVTVPPTTATGADGWVSLQFTRLAGFPVSSHQQLMVMFIRASAPGANVLTGVSTERLISFPVNLKSGT